MSEKKFEADLEQHTPKLDITANILRARLKAGKAYGAQIREIIRLGRKPTKLTPQDYFYFQLYDDSKYTPDEKSRFLVAPVA